MRVLVVVHGFPPAAQGGSEIYAFEHAHALRERHRDEVLVLTREQDPRRAEYSVRREVRDGITVAWVNNTFRCTRSFEETYRNPAIDGIAARLIAEFRPDVAHVHHLTCLSTNIVHILAARGVPVVFTLHDYWLMCHRGQLLDERYERCDGPSADGVFPCADCPGAVGARTPTSASLLRFAERALPQRVSIELRRTGRRVAAALSRPGVAARRMRARFDEMQRVCDAVTHFLAPSRCLRERFIAFGIAPDRITLSRYGFDRRRFRSASRDRSPRLRLGFLGSLMISKAPHVLLEAFARLPSGAATVDLYGAHCAYHGDDTYRQTLEPLLAVDGVRLHGPIAHDHVGAALASIDALVVPSIWAENSPLVIQEAFLAGVPVIASRIGGIPELVEDGKNGLLFAPGDAADLQRVLARLLREPALLDRLRSGIPAMRTIEDDVDSGRTIFEAHIAQARPQQRQAEQRRIAAVVLNYRTPDDTLLAVRSLLASRRPADDIIVVDNDQGDGCRRALDPVLADVRYVNAGRNLGFSGGVNVGIRAALENGSDAVMLVNSDVFVPPDCVERLEATLQRRRDAGIVAPVVVSRSDPGRVATLGMSYHPLTGRMRHQAVGRRIGHVAPGRERDVQAVSGCLMLITREVFDAIGLFDEDYFFTFEDLDFCLRARRAGFATIVSTDARAYHEGSRSIGAASPLRVYFAARNHLLLAARSEPQRRGVSAWLRNGSIVALNVAHAVLSRSGSLGSRLMAVAEGTRDYAVGAYGVASDARRVTR